MNEKMGLEVRLPSSKNWVLPSVKAVQLLPGPLFPYESTEEIIVSILQGYCMDSLNECNVLEQWHIIRIQEIHSFNKCSLVQYYYWFRCWKWLSQQNRLHPCSIKSLGTYFLVGRGKQWHLYRDMAMGWTVSSSSNSYAMVFGVLGR